jgi:hypothetical protein
MRSTIVPRDDNDGPFAVGISSSTGDVVLRAISPQCAKEDATTMAAAAGGRGGRISNRSSGGGGAIDAIRDGAADGMRREGLFRAVVLRGECNDERPKSTGGEEEDEIDDGTVSTAVLSHSCRLERR